MEKVTWRDYADELTAEQVAELESWEEQDDDGRGSSMRQKALAACARDMARRNRWARQYADIPAPTDATYTSEWHSFDDIETPARYFEGGRWPHVHVGGLQNPDGTVRERWISVTTGPASRGSASPDVGSRRLRSSCAPPVCSSSPWPSPQRPRSFGRPPR
jgi:hypothetical protein